MGGIVHSLFGGSSSKSSSSSNNLAYPAISSELTPAVTSGVNNFNDLSSQLGEGFDAFKKNSGFNFALNRGNNNIVGGAAANGMLNSGSTDKALAQYEGNLGSQTYQNYMGDLLGAAQTGIGAANPIVGAGQVSQGQQSGTNDGNGILGSIISGPGHLFL